MKMKNGIIIIALAVFAASAGADLELTVDIDYPRRIEFTTPVQEDADFEMQTSFGTNEYFAVTGHVGQITGVSSNRAVNLTYGYKFKLGNSSGSATGSGLQPLDGHMSMRIISSIWVANPRFVVREVNPPPSPLLSLTNMTPISNVTWSVTSNKSERTAQPTNAPYSDPAARSQKR